MRFYRQSAEVPSEAALAALLDHEEEQGALEGEAAAGDAAAARARGASAGWSARRSLEAEDTAANKGEARRSTKLLERISARGFESVENSDDSDADGGAAPPARAAGGVEAKEEEGSAASELVSQSSSSGAAMTSTKRVSLECPSGYEVKEDGATATERAERHGDASPADAPPPPALPQTESYGDASAADAPDPPALLSDASADAPDLPALLHQLLRCGALSYDRFETLLEQERLSFSALDRDEIEGESAEPGSLGDDEDSGDDELEVRRVRAASSRGCVSHMRITC